jgi:DNA-binding YbaB/EbfC family protein
MIDRNAIAPPNLTRNIPIGYNNLMLWVRKPHYSKILPQFEQIFVSQNRILSCINILITVSVKLIMTQGKGFGFGLGKIKELQEAFQKAQQVQEGAKQLQEDLEKMEIEGSSEDGSVTVTMSGNQEPLGIVITPTAYEKGADVLSASITEAMKAAYAQSTETMRAKMEELTSGLNLPGL